MESVDLAPEVFGREVAAARALDGRDLTARVGLLQFTLTVKDNGSEVSFSTWKSVRCFSPRDPSVVRSIPLEGVFSLTWSHDARRLLAATSDARVHAIELDGSPPKALFSFGRTDSLANIKPCGPSRLVASFGAGAVPEIWGMDGSHPAWSPGAPIVSGPSLTCDRDGRTLFAPEPDGGLVGLSTDTGKVTVRMPGLSGQPPTSRTMISV